MLKFVAAIIRKSFSLISREFLLLLNWDLRNWLPAGLTLGHGLPNLLIEDLLCRLGVLGRCLVNNSLERCKRFHSKGNAYLSQVIGLLECFQIKKMKKTLLHTHSYTWLYRYMKKTKSVSCSGISNSLRLHGLCPARLLCPWNSPGKNSGVGSYSLPQGIFPTHIYVYMQFLMRRWESTP